MKLFPKILITILGTCFIVFGAVIGFNLYKTSSFAVDSAGQLASKEGEKQANQVETELNHGMDIVKTLAYMLSVMVQEHKADRPMASSILKKVLEENEHILGTWTVWEPNAFDGKDSDYSNTLGHDATGRFVPYWNRGKGELMLEPVKGYDQRGTGDFYLAARDSGKEMILEPYPYHVGDKEVW